MWSPDSLRAQIKKQGRTTRWLAKQCGITLGSFQQVMLGRKPSIRVVKLLCLALECTEAELGFEEESEATAYAQIKR